MENSRPYIKKFKNDICVLDSQVQLICGSPDKRHIRNRIENLKVLIASFQNTEISGTKGSWIQK
jgi:hypothetical protein